MMGSYDLGGIIIKTEFPAVHKENLIILTHRERG